MHRILVTVVSLYWFQGFALRAADAAGLGGAWLPEVWSTATLASLAFALVAALFLWAAIASFGGPEEGTADVVAMATCAAIVTLAVVAPATGQGPGGNLSAELGVHVSALCATWLVARVADSSTESRSAEDRSTGQARRMAADAAHGSMLARLSGRPDTAGSEA
jgi:hypothetical protein